MDCCEPTKKSSDKEGKSKVDMKSVVLWAIIALLVIAVVYIVFLRPSAASQVVSSAGQAASSYNSMIGNC